MIETNGIITSVNQSVSGFSIWPLQPEPQRLSEKTKSDWNQIAWNGRHLITAGLEISFQTNWEDMNVTEVGRCNMLSTTRWEKKNKSDSFLGSD